MHLWYLLQARYIARRVCRPVANEVKIVPPTRHSSFYPKLELETFTKRRYLFEAELFITDLFMTGV